MQKLAQDSIDTVTEESRQPVEEASSDTSVNRSDHETGSNLEQLLLESAIQESLKMPKQSLTFHSTKAGHVSSVM